MIRIHTGQNEPLAPDASQMAVQTTNAAADPPVS